MDWAPERNAPTEMGEAPETSVRIAKGARIDRHDNRWNCELPKRSTGAQKPKPKARGEVSWKSE